MAIVPTETVVGTATLIAEATRVSRASGVTTGAVEKESVTVSGAWRVTPAALVQSVARLTASWQASLRACVQELVLSWRSKVRLLIAMSLIWARPSQILPTVLPFEFGMGMETVIDCWAICPQTIYLPLTNELLGQTFKEVVCQLLELRPILVNVVRTLLIFWERLLMASVVVLPLPVTWTFRVAISGFTLRVEAPLTSMVFQPQLAAQAGAAVLPNDGKEGVGMEILGILGKEGVLMLRELP